MEEKNLDMIADEILKKYSNLENKYFFNTGIYHILAVEYPDMAIRDCEKIIEKIVDKIISV